jgi:hypothetical protein
MQIRGDDRDSLKAKAEQVTRQPESAGRIPGLRERLVNVCERLLA